MRHHSFINGNFLVESIKSLRVSQNKIEKFPYPVNFCQTLVPLLALHCCYRQDESIARFEGTWSVASQNWFFPDELLAIIAPVHLHPWQLYNPHEDYNCQDGFHFFPGNWGPFLSVFNRFSCGLLIMVQLGQLGSTYRQWTIIEKSPLFTVIGISLSRTWWGLPKWSSTRCIIIVWPLYWRILRTFSLTSPCTTSSTSSSASTHISGTNWTAITRSFCIYKPAKQTASAPQMRVTETQ